MGNAHVLSVHPRVQQDQPLARFTAARLGGPAEYLYLARPATPVEELVEVVSAAWAAGLPVRVLGGGANVLVSDRGVRGLVVVNHMNGVRFDDGPGGGTVIAASGTGLITLARRCAAQGLTGMEWAVGVPGTVGGAVVNNAGAHGADIAASLVQAAVLDADTGLRQYSCAELQYAYRRSALKARPDRRFLVLEAVFRLGPDDPQAVQQRMAEYNAYRKRTQPPGASLGSIFKNPPGDYAGRLIEASGLKGLRMGAVAVSDVHANFIVSQPGATAAAYWALIEHVRDVVQQQTGVVLELEIERVGEW